MNPADAHLLRVVTEDLEFLRETWGDTTDDATLRRGSTLLRSLLVHGNYSRAWRLAGFEKEPEVVAHDLARVLRGIKREKIDYAQSGGADFNGLQIGEFLETKELISPEQMKLLHSLLTNEPTIIYKLSKFIRSISIVSKGYTITREEVVQYVANKLGGAHVDSSRKGYETSFIALDRTIGTRIGSKEAVYRELLSIGQALATSPDTTRFLTRAHELLP